MKARVALTITIFLVLVSFSYSAAAIEFTEDELTKLQAGKTVRKSLKNSMKGGFYGGTGWAVIDAPVGAIWKALFDFEEYCKHFPSCVETKEISRKGDRSLVKQKLGYNVLSVTYHVTCVRDFKNNMLSFELVKNMPHDIDSARGYWRMFPQKDGRTLVGYAVAVRAPIGIAVFLGPRVEKKLESALIGLPGYLKKWIEGPSGKRYRKK